MDSRSARLISRVFLTTEDELRGGLSVVANEQRAASQHRKRQREEEKIEREERRAGLHSVNISTAGKHGYLRISDDDARALNVVGYRCNILPLQADPSSFRGGDWGSSTLVAWEGRRDGRQFPSTASLSAGVADGDDVRSGGEAEDALLVDISDARREQECWESFAKPPRAVRAATRRALRSAATTPSTSKVSSSASRPASRHFTHEEALTILGPGWSPALESESSWEAFRDALPPPPRASGAEHGSDCVGVGSADSISTPASSCAQGWWVHPFKFSPFAIPTGALSGLPRTQEHAMLVETTARRIAAAPQLELVLRVRQAGVAQFSFLQPDDPLHPYYEHLKGRACNGVGEGVDWPEPEPVQTMEGQSPLVPAEAVPPPLPTVKGLGLVAYGEEEEDEDEEEEGRARSDGDGRGGGCNEMCTLTSAAAQESVPAKKKSRFGALPPEVEASLPPRMDSGTAAGSGSGVGVGVGPPPAPAVPALDPPAALTVVMDKLLAHASAVAATAAGTGPASVHSSGAGASIVAVAAAGSFLAVVATRERGNHVFSFLQPWSPYHEAWQGRVQSLLHKLSPPAPAAQEAPASGANRVSAPLGTAVPAADSCDAIPGHDTTSPLPSTSGPGNVDDEGTSSATQVCRGKEREVTPKPAWLRAALARGYYNDEDSDGDIDEPLPGMEPSSSHAEGHSASTAAQGDDSDSGDSPEHGDDMDID